MALSAMFILEVVIVFSFIVTSLFMFIPKKNEAVHKIFFCAFRYARHSRNLYQRNLASVKYANANGCLLALPCACRNRNYNFGCQWQA